MNKIGFIGAGNIATAIIKGIANSHLGKDSQIFVTDIDVNKGESLKKYGATFLSTSAEVVKECKYIFLAVIPQVMRAVLDEISPHITSNTVLVSNAAGLSVEYFKSRTNENVKVILAMPNTPLLIGHGATAISYAPPTSEDELSYIHDIYSSCGEVALIPADKMKEVIAINGSSPAFIYLFAKGFIDYGISQGIDEESVKRLFAQSLIGAAKMITDSGHDVDELIKMVSSPGGTTMAGLSALSDGDLLDTVNNACNACTNRAYELGK